MGEYLNRLFSLSSEPLCRYESGRPTPSPRKVGMPAFGCSGATKIARDNRGYLNELLRSATSSDWISTRSLPGTWLCQAFQTSRSAGSLAGGLARPSAGRAKRGRSAIVSPAERASLTRKMQFRRAAIGCDPSRELRKPLLPSRRGWQRTIQRLQLWAAKIAQDLTFQWSAREPRPQQICFASDLPKDRRVLATCVLTECFFGQL
jgi:hypothetical protein